MDAHVASGRAAGSPIPGLIVRSGETGHECADPWTEQVWPPPGGAVPELADFTPERHLLLGRHTVGLGSEPSARPTDRILSVISGRVLAILVDLRVEGQPRREVRNELEAGTTVIIPAGVAFGYEALSAPALLSVLESHQAMTALAHKESPASGAHPASPISLPAPPAPAAARRPYRVLFLCTANICRSAYAEAAANARPHEGIEFASAGIHALSGHRIDPPMEACLPLGADGTAHRARPLTRSEMEDADLVLALAGEHRRYVLEEWPDLGRKTFLLGHVAREIQDLPADITLENLAQFLWRRRTTDSNDEVADPYRRGPEAAEGAARKIDSFLDALLAGLTSLAAPRAS